MQVRPSRQDGRGQPAMPGGQMEGGRYIGLPLAARAADSGMAGAEGEGGGGVWVWATTAGFRSRESECYSWDRSKCVSRSKVMQAEAQSQIR